MSRLSLHSTRGLRWELSLSVIALSAPRCALFVTTPGRGCAKEFGSASVLFSVFRLVDERSLELELEHELIQAQAQKPVLRVEVGAGALRVRSVSRDAAGMGERGCARRVGGWMWV